MKSGSFFSLARKISQDRSRWRVEAGGPAGYEGSLQSVSAAFLCARLRLPSSRQVDRDSMQSSDRIPLQLSRLSMAAQGQEREEKRDESTRASQARLVAHILSLGILASARRRLKLQ